MRNAVQRDIKTAKQSYFGNMVERNRGDPKKLWGQLRSLGYSKKAVGGSSNIVLEQDNVKIHDSYSVACVFNRFYTCVAADLVSKLPSPTGMFDTASLVFKRLYSRFTRPSHAFTLTPVSRGFILKQLRSLDPNKAVGLDGISSRFLRDGADVISQPVCHLVNMSILTETVPSGFKNAKVIPLFKKGSKLEPGNYRPVSILNVLSKVLEKAVHFQLVGHLKAKNVLYKNQSGFRGSYSTDTCLVGLSDYVKGEMGKGNLVGMVLIDLQKAFDTVDHEILLSKLDAIGVTSVSWFRSYLSDRQQCVEIGGVLSDFLDVTCGVPQGSILGPQLFLIYINDMCNSVQCDLLLYADDSALVFSHKDPIFISDHLSSQLTTCKHWLIDNKLSLHVGKTECILFGSKRRLKKVRGFQVTCEGSLVNQVAEVTYLGVKLDENLDGRAHAVSLIKKCAGRLAFLYRNSALLNLQNRKTLCTALVQPYLDYCCSSWYSGLTKQLQGKLNVIQRRMVRFIYGFHHMHHVDNSDLKSLSWLNVEDRVRFFKVVHVFRVRSGLAPSYLTANFVPLADHHSYRTRGSSHDYAITAIVARASSSFSFTAIKAWNSLPAHLKSLTSLNVFKRKVKEMFLSSY